jgi:hypothetical protein
VTTGFQNTSVGSNSLISTSTGSYNTALGYNTGPNGLTFFNTTCLGIDAIASGSDMIVIGNTFVNWIGGYQNWTTYSDGRVKQNVDANVPGLEFVMKLEPVTYILDVDAINKQLGIERDEPAASPEGAAHARTMLRSGFIAQDVEAAARSVGYDFSGVCAPKNENDFYGLRYAEFVVPLVKSVQELKQMVDELSATVEAQQQIIEALRTGEGGTVH